MKRLCAFLLTISLFFLCACKGEEEKEDKFQLWKDTFLNQNIELDCKLTSLNQEENLDFKIKYVCENGNQKIQIIEPAELEGVYFSISSEGKEMSFGEILLEINLDDKELSPLNSLPLLREMVEEGFLKSSWTEKDGENELFAFELERGDGLKLNIFLNEEMQLKNACFIKNEQVKIKIEFQ